MAEAKLEAVYVKKTHPRMGYAAGKVYEVSADEKKKMEILEMIGPMPKDVKEAKEEKWWLKKDK